MLALIFEVPDSVVVLSSKIRGQGKPAGFLKQLPATRIVRFEPGGAFVVPLIFTKSPKEYSLRGSRTNQYGWTFTSKLFSDKFVIVKDAFTIPTKRTVMKARNKIF
jgi:hypothetical protein